MWNLAVFLLTTGLLLACAQAAENVDEAGSLLLPKAKAPAFVLLTKSCPLAKLEGREEAFLPLVVAAVATAAVSAGTEYVIDEVTLYLKERANAFNASSQAIGNGFLYRTTEAQQKLAGPILAGCLIFFRAEQDALASEDPTGEPPEPAEIAPDLSEINLQIRDVAENLAEAGSDEPVAYLKGAPEVYGEFLLQLEQLPLNQGDGTQPIRFGLRPVYIDFDKTGAERSEGDEKQLIFDTHIQAMLGDGTLSTLHQDRFVFNGLKPGAAPLRYLDDEGRPGALFAKRAKLTALPLPEEREVGGNKVLWLVPVTTTVTLTETEPGAGDLERRFAEKLAAKKSEFSEAAVSLTDAQVQRMFGAEKSDERSQ